MSRPPLLSIIIVTYESSREITACLDSIPAALEQGSVEIIVMDNDSRDGTADLVESKYPHPQVTLLRAGGNLGFSCSNNLAYLHARGRLILFLNPDTIVNAPALQHCADRLLNEPDIGIISPRLVQADGSLDLACRRSIPSVWDGFTRATGLAKAFPKSRFFAGYNLTWLPVGDTYPVGAVNGAFMMIPRRLLEQIGLLDEQFFMYGEDLDLCYRCKKAGHAVIYDGRRSIIHLKGQSSAKNYRAASRQVFISTEQFYQKHFNPKNSPLVRWKYRFLFRLWCMLSGLIATVAGHKQARPV